jgi:NADH-quinone oxidoreductase subunit L
MIAALAVALPFLGAAAALLLPRWPRRGATGRVTGGATGGPAGGAVGGVAGAATASVVGGAGSDRAAGDAAVYRRAAWFAVLPTAGALVLSVWSAFYLWAGNGLPRGAASLAPGGTVPFWSTSLPGSTESTLTLIDTGSIPISLGLRVDGLAALVGVLVTVVALAVQVYSIGYMRHEPRYPSYAAFIALFTSAMLLVVYAGDLIVLYVGWEVMGLCSYLLIGHWWEDRANSRAAVKAFLVTRLGDVGFLFGIFTLGFAAGSFRIDDVIQKLPEMSTGTVVAATMLLLAGVAGKSAQVPLHTWLPDAMAGPTPISALIHAATMVAAGIFIVARLYPAFLAARPTLDVLAVLAAVGMLGAALAALAQDDLKRVLAYSTISQLAYMAGALAAGSDEAAIFHLLTHGAFKALLFLCAGAVIHRVESNLLRDMGGLRHAMPFTFGAMTIGFAALVGLPPASGFFSKDAVLVAVEHAVGGRALTDAAAWLLYACALATVAVTGAYATRAWLRAFFGESRLSAVPLKEPEPGTAHVWDPREAPPTMLWPIGVLAVPALLLGFARAGAVEWGPAAISLVVALLGAGIVYVAWRGEPMADPARVLGPLRTPCERAFYVDSAYNTLFVRPVTWLARAVVRTDDKLVDGAVRGSGRLTLNLSALVRLAQNGNAQLYVTGALAGILLVAIGAVIFR